MRRQLWQPPDLLRFGGDPRREEVIGKVLLDMKYGVDSSRSRLAIGVLCGEGCEVTPRRRASSTTLGMIGSEP
jgi:hypothetical protein